MYKCETHVAGMLIKHMQGSQEAVRIEVRRCCFCCNPFWASENRPATQEQLRGTFRRILSSDLPGAACGSLLGAHIPSWKWASRSYTFPGPSIKAKKNFQKSLRSCSLWSAIPWPESVFAFESVCVPSYLADWLLLWQLHISLNRLRHKSLIRSRLSHSGCIQHMPKIR